MEATKEMDTQLKRIYMPSVFYFPKELFPDLSPETKKELKEYHFFEDLGIIKDNGDVGSLKTSFNALEIYKKDGVLEGNIFQFLEMRERLNEDAFRFLLDKYLSHVKTWVYVYNWLLNNFDKQIPKTSKKEKSMFEYQYKILDNHLAKLNQKFKFNFKNIAAINLVDVISKNKSIFPFDKSIYNNLKGSLKKIDISTKVNTSKQYKKQILLTDLEADEFLLKTVFNMKIA